MREMSLKHFSIEDVMLAIAEIDDNLPEGQADAASTVDVPIRTPLDPRLPELTSHATSTTTIDAEREPAATTAPIVEAPVRSHGFRLLQQWEGVVSGVTGDVFTAVLRDLTNRSSSEESASFEIDQIDPPDRRLIVPGAVFYWWIGYRDSPTGTRWTVSTIRFRRLPAWTRSDMRLIKREVEAFRRLFAER
jgi:hypothetical protein